MARLLRQSLYTSLTQCVIHKESVIVRSIAVDVALNRTKPELNYHPDYPTTAEYKEKHVPGMTRSRAKLMSLLGFSKETAIAIIREYKEFAEMKPSLIVQNYETYKSNGISDNVLQKYPLLLTSESTENKLRLMLYLPIPLNDVAPLALLPLERLIKLVELALEERTSVPGGSRIKYLSANLKCPIDVVCYNMSQHTFLWAQNFHKMHTNMKILLEYKVAPEDILADMWSLRYAPHQIVSRLSKAVECNIHRIRPWMIRCPVEVIETAINRSVESQRVLNPHQTLVNYLAERLQCSEENITTILKKHPVVRSVHPLKVKEMLDMLFEEGVPPQHIWLCPLILLRSIDTLKARINLLKEINYKPASLIFLCRSKRFFDKWYNQIKARNKKT